MNHIPKVSVLMITYNHERYIRHALDSVLMQRVSFPYEVVIGDDCSTDGTQKILREYKEKYPDKIRLILHQRNHGPAKNVYSVLKRMSGEYIAVLEGDDYWCDELKLQKQVDFLETHREYVGCTHEFHIVDEEEHNVEVFGIKTIDYMHKPYVFENSECTLRDYENSMGIPSHMNTVVYRNIYREVMERYKILCRMHPVIFDQTLYVWLLTQGKLYMMSDDMSAYRYVVKKGNSNATSMASCKNNRGKHFEYQCRLEKGALKYWDCRVDLSKEKRNLLIGAVCVWIESRKKEDFAVVVEITKASRCPVHTIMDIFNIVIRKLYYKLVKHENVRITP